MKVWAPAWRAVAAGCAAALVAAACGGSPPTSAARVGTPATRSATSKGSLAAWQKLGATEVPPASLRQVTLGATRVVNQTNGAVSDADAGAWAEAFLRTYGYVQWAVEQNQGQFLVDGGLSGAPLSVFRPNLSDILAGELVKGQTEYTLQTFRRLIVRQAPPSLQPLYAAERFVWTPYAIYLDAVGPASTTVVDADGHRTVKVSIAAGVPEYELIGGQLVHSALMGDVWMLDADFDCLSPAIRQAVAPLCQP